MGELLLWPTVFCCLVSGSRRTAAVLSGAAAGLSLSITGIVQRSLTASGLGGLDGLALAALPVLVTVCVVLTARARHAAVAQELVPDLLLVAALAVVAVAAVVALQAATGRELLLNVSGVGDCVGILANLALWHRCASRDPLGRRPSPAGAVVFTVIVLALQLLTVAWVHELGPALDSVALLTLAEASLLAVCGGLAAYPAWRAWSREQALRLTDAGLA